jgi:hypothetical protein
MLDCIANELMLDMYQEFNGVYARFHRRYVQRYVFAGDELELTRIPLMLQDIRGRKQETEHVSEEEQQPLKTCCDQGITANEYGVLLPSKSVVFYAVLSENPNQECEGLCIGCNNVNCENRIVREEKADRENTNGKNLNYGYQRIFGS